MASRFQKKSAPRLPTIPGTKPSLFNYQLLTSTGVPGVDNLLGGGLSIGTVAIFEDMTNACDQEETGSCYSQVLLKYFLSEGIFHNHELFIGSAFNSGQNIQLPAIVSQARSENQADKDLAENTSEKLKIAWRYEGQAPKDAAISSARSQGQHSHHFNLNKSITEEELVKHKVSYWRMDSQNSNVNEYDSILEAIKDKCKGYLISPDKVIDQVLRIVIFDVGSVIWSNDNSSSMTDLTTFLFKLRQIARTHMVVISLSLSPDFFIRHEVNGFVHRRVKELGDVVIDFTAFGKAERQQGVFKDHHGIVEIVKAASLNSLTSPVVRSLGSKYLFKSLRTKFVIEPMHLPPDLGDDSDSKKTILKDKLEF